MYGLENYSDQDNIYIRNAFYKGNIEQMNIWATNNLAKGTGPLMEAMQEREPLTDTENKNNMLTFSFAGHDTTAHTLTWLIFELSKNNLFYSTIQKEIDSFWEVHLILQRTLNMFKELTFTTKCIFEILRLYPAVANGTFREIEHEQEISTQQGSFLLAKGDWVQIPNYPRHRSIDLWGYDANVFNPNRKFNSDEIWDNNGFNFNNPYSNRFSPFSFPPRDCIGKNFSQMEMRVIILHLFKDFKFYPTTFHQQTINDLTMGPRDHTNLNKTALYINIQPRFNLNQAKL